MSYEYISQENYSHILSCMHLTLILKYCIKYITLHIFNKKL